MANRSRETKDARRLERVYATREHGTSHQAVLNLIRERGLEGAIRQLEAWGMVATVEPVARSGDERGGG